MHIKIKELLMFLSRLKSFFVPDTTDVLLKNENIYVDKTFFNRCLKGKYLLNMKYGKVKVGLLKRQIDKKIYDLTENDLYKYLQNREKEGKMSSSFEQLIENIEKNGFDTKSVIICKYRSNLIKDGQHRAIYLLWKYGPDYDVDTIHIRVKKRLLRFQLFPCLKKKF